MDEKLLKKLKKSGFTFIEHDDDEINKVLYGGIGYSITLPELIRACGNRFGNLQSVFSEGKQVIVGWICSGAGMAIPDYCQNTPEEAVAELWLKINKK